MVKEYQNIVRGTTTEPSTTLSTTPFTTSSSTTTTTTSATVSTETSTSAVTSTSAESTIDLLLIPHITEGLDDATSTTTATQSTTTTTTRYILFRSFQLSAVHVLSKTFNI